MKQMSLRKLLSACFSAFATLGVFAPIARASAADHCYVEFSETPFLGEKVERSEAMDGPCRHLRRAIPGACPQVGGGNHPGRLGTPSQKGDSSQARFHIAVLPLFGSA